MKDRKEQCVCCKLTCSCIYAFEDGQFIVWRHPSLPTKTSLIGLFDDINKSFGLEKMHSKHQLSSMYATNAITGTRRIGNPL